MTQENRPKDVGPDEHRRMSRDEDTEGHQRESGDEPLSIKQKMPLAIPDADEADTEGHKK
jgi:hypothetical protein